MRTINASERVAVERIVDQITTLGTVELEFCFYGRLGVLGAYIPQLSGKSPRFAYWSTRDTVLGTECGQYLRRRSRELVSETDLAAWAVKHRWPNPERFEPGASAESVADAIATDAAVLEGLSEGGKYDPRTAFLFNLNIVVWDPVQRKFGFPDIPDHRIAYASREYLRRAGLALHDQPKKEPEHIADPFAVLIEYATNNTWPAIEAFMTRATEWRTLRHVSGAVRKELSVR
jgi:hypothetical protein